MRLWGEFGDDADGEGTEGGSDPYAVYASGSDPEWARVGRPPKSEYAGTRDDNQHDIYEIAPTREAVRELARKTEIEVDAPEGGAAGRAKNERFIRWMRD